MTTPAAPLRYVLMARPHPLIADAMRSMLTAGGWASVSSNDDGSWPAVPARAMVGAIVSTAVQSTARVSTMEAFDLARYKRPGLPIVFATLAPVDRIAQSLQLDVTKRDPGSRVVTLRDAHSLRRGDVLLLHKDEIVTQVPLVAGILLEHFAAAATGAR